jgi:hypothetical protein
MVSAEHITLYDSSLKVENCTEDLFSILMAVRCTNKEFHQGVTGILLVEWLRYSPIQSVIFTAIEIIQSAKR